MDIRITKDADKLLCTLYKSYLEKIKYGLSKDESNYFDNSEKVRGIFFPNWSIADVSHTCWELKRAGLINCSQGDDLANDIELTTDAIIRMENHFIDGLKSVAEFLSNFIP